MKPDKKKVNNNRIKIKEILRFLVGGTSAVVTDYFVYQALLSLKWEMTLAKSVSYVCGAVVGFIINKFWTFESSGYSGTEIVKYAVLYALSACANAVVNRGVIMTVQCETAGFLCATGVSTIMNFIGQKFIVFNKNEQR